MPIYEYQCENGHRFEAFQSMSEDALDTCPDCGASARRLMRAPAVHFKGSGFYTTDYGKKKSPSSGSGTGGSSDSGSSSESSGGGSDSSSGSGGSSDSKPTKAESPTS